MEDCGCGEETGGIAGWCVGMRDEARRGISACREEGGRRVL